MYNLAGWVYFLFFMYKVYFSFLTYLIELRRVPGLGNKLYSLYKTCQ